MKITPSHERVTFDKLREALGAGKTIANVFDVVMDQRFVEQLRHDWCWLSAERLPAGGGWYKINRASNELLQITEADASLLEWHERMFMYKNGHAAAKEGIPLALYIGDEYSDGRLSALYLCGPDVFAWVAQKDAGKE